MRKASQQDLCYLLPTFIENVVLSSSIFEVFLMSQKSALHQWMNFIKFKIKIEVDIADTDIVAFQIVIKLLMPIIMDVAIHNLLCLTHVIDFVFYDSYLSFD